MDEISGKLLADDEWHQVGITFDSGYGSIYIYIHISCSTYTQEVF